MNAKDYLTMAGKPKIIVYDENGQEIPMLPIGSERPTLDDLRNICKRKISFGKSTFIDTFEVLILKSCKISRATLYYEETLVGLREFPDILLMNGDSLTIKFVVTIVIDHAQVNLFT
jgi:hypothetical protein